MKQLVFSSLTIAIAFAACNNPPAEKHSSTTTVPDTFHFCGKVVKMEKIDSAAFAQVPAVSTYDTSEAKNILNDSATVKRIGDTLFFKVQSGRRTLLVNNNDSVGDEASVYIYQGYNDIGQYVVYGGFYEWFYFLLIDGKTGDTTISWGQPVVSPDKKYFVSGNTDLQAGFTNNGLQLFEAANPPRLVCEKDLQRWGPESIKWLNNTTVAVKANVWDTTVPDYQRTEYYKMDLR